ncbi:MAG TPA: nuclease-related domain-containing protein, partial [Candidatus Paceibacterota bacterium]
ATGQQFRVQLADGWLRGRMDGRGSNIPEAPKTVHVIECKSHNEKSFMELWKRKLKDGKKDHYAQCQAYMHAQQLTRCLYIAVNKNTDEIYCERVAYDKAYGAALETRAARLVRSDVAPPRLFEDINSKGAYVCNWCRSKGQCHEGELARQNCRTCISASFEPGAVVRCTLLDKKLSYEDQQVGCSQHLYLPSLVPGEQLDASEEQRWVKYRLHDGSEWVDGGKT